MKLLEVAKSPRPLQACIPRRLEWTLHSPPLPFSLLPRTYFVYNNLRKENLVQRWSIHTPVCVVTVRKNIVNVLIDNSEHGNLDRESGS